MKILHVGPIERSRAAGGPNQSIRGLAAALAEIGLDVGLLPSVPLPPDSLNESIPGVYLFEGPRRRHLNPWFISRDWVSRIQREFGTPDIVNFHSTYIPFQTALAHRFRRLGWPYIITPRGGMTYLAQSNKQPKKILGNLTFFRSYVKHAAAVHALSAGEAKQIQEQFKVEKLFIVPNAVPDELFDAPRRLPPADLGEFKDNCNLMLGFVGRIDVYIKGLDLLLEALSRVNSQQKGAACKLIIVGPFAAPRDEKYVSPAIKRLGLEHIVKLVGPKYEQDKWRHFLAFDVCAQTSRTEGMPMAVLEAMALGRPCLVTPGTNIGDVVREGGGWVCEPESKSIAETIKSIYDKRDTLKALGQQSRQIVQTRFTQHKIARQLNEEYAKIIGQ